MPHLIAVDPWSQGLPVGGHCSRLPVFNNPSHLCNNIQFTHCGHSVSLCGIVNSTKITLRGIYGFYFIGGVFQAQRSSGTWWWTKLKNLLSEKLHFTPKLPVPPQLWGPVLGKEGAGFQYPGREHPELSGGSSSNGSESRQPGSKCRVISH